MSELYYLNVTIHVLAALLWLGGMFFFAAVGAPVLRAVEPPALRANLFRLLGERFRRIGWWAISILVVTGIVNLHLRGLLTAEVWTNSSFWGTGMGKALAWKLVAVTAMVSMSAYHDFVAGPAASRLEPGSPTALKARKRAAMLGRVNALIGLVVVIAAVRLARGG